MKKKVLIAAGGTGGHLLPAQELAEMLGNRAEILFAGHQLEKSRYFRRNQFRFFDIVSASTRNKFAFCFALCVGFCKSISLIIREKPDVVVGFGSFHTVPVLLAATVLRKKIVLYEANRTVGKVTRLFAPFSKHLAAQFPLLDRKKFTLVPLFPWIPKAVPSRAEARKDYGIHPDRFTILVFGGSQGASFLNEMIPKAVSLLGKEVQVIHFGMEQNPYTVMSYVKQFESNMARAYAAADFVIGRSGAGTVAELICYQKPALLIPYPYAYGHQEDNANYLVQLGQAFMLLQKDATSEKIADCISNAALLHVTAADAQKRTPIEELIL